MSMARVATVFAVIAMLVAGSVLPAMAQDDEVRLDLDFNGETLGQILQMLGRGYNLQYTLGEDVDPDMRITTHLRGVTLGQALTSILEPNGLLAIDQDGRYIIKQRPEPQARDTEATTVVPQAAAGTRTPPPSPTRQPRSYVPGASTAGEDEEGTDQEADRILEIIWPRYLGADMASSIFGGSVIEPGGYYGGGSGGSGGYGGYGGSSYGGGRGGYGGSSYGGGRGGYGGSSYGRSSGGRSSSFGRSSGGRSDYGY